MPQVEPDIAHCHACGGAMNVTAVAPYSNVECPSCGAHNRVKREFGQYTLTRRHAIGGMSVVFQARDNTLGREVALKILNENYSADERRIAAFEEEARITASFSHPNVVRVFTTGRAFGRFYIAMEWVPGGHFEQRIADRGALPERDVLPLAVQVAEGLKAARAAGLIHRDIKPGNILFDAADNAKIVDFGLALVTKGGVAQAKELWATPYYVPPETVEGHPEDFRSDVYAFGATLYHALAGRPPCEEESMSTTVLREAKKKIPPLRSVAPWLSLETCAVVERAMAYDPVGRFSSYDQMLAQLRNARQRALDAPPPAAAAGPGRARRRGAGSTPARARLAAAAAAVLVLVGAGVWWFGRAGGGTAAAAAPAPAAGIVDATGGELPPVVPPPVRDEPAPAPDPAAAAGIAARFREARASLDAGDFARARVEFAALRDDRQVQEPTRSWSGVEAVVAAYLDGDSEAALTEAQAAASHLSEVPTAGDEIRRRVLPVLTGLAGLRPILPAPALPESGVPVDGPLLVAWLLSGLKNWDQGQPQFAAGFFSAVAAADLAPEDAWAAVYQEAARAYLADHEILTSELFEDYPSTPEEAEALIGRLDAKLDALQTRGRARFNLRAWQLDLARHAQVINARAAASAVRPDADTLFSKLAGFADECRFADAGAYLATLEEGPADVSLKSLLTLNESAAAFLNGLEADLVLARTPTALQLKQGGQVTALAVADPGALRGRMADGRSADFAWRDFTPDSIHDLYRALVRVQPSESVRLNRHESAIAFEWLAGDRARAMIAAERLAQENAEFKDRWEQIAAGLPE